ncbi:MAG: hypothetical protein K0U84_13510 [Actinomycetia bacterium]|nr:hypothetical protein [Actinomycetes bacterium]
MLDRYLDFHGKLLDEVRGQVDPALRTLMHLGAGLDLCLDLDRIIAQVSVQGIDRLVQRLEGLSVVPIGQVINDPCGQ